MLPKPPSPPPLSAEFHSTITLPQPSAGVQLPKPQLPGAQLPSAQPPAVQPPAVQPPAVQPPAAQPPAGLSQGWSLFRSSDGKTRIDQGTQSLISDPKASQTIRLDHLKQEAQVFP